jgi:hypothetical protein
LMHYSAFIFEMKYSASTEAMQGPMQTGWLVDVQPIAGICARRA